MNDIDLKLPSQESVENRFSFIKDEVLRSNIAIALRYVTFLVELEVEYTLPGAISYSLYKNIILYTATIVESCIFYFLKELLSEKKFEVEYLMGSGWNYKDISELHKISSNEKIFGVRKVKVVNKLRKSTQFKDLIDALKRTKLIKDSLIDRINNLREKRNKIHLAGLKDSDTFYDKSDIDYAFKTAKQVLEVIEKELS